MIVTALAVLLHFGIIAKAENKTSFAYYGIMSRDWRCKASLNAAKKSGDIRLSFLYNTFGTSFKCVKDFVASGQLKLIEIHLINETCLRNSRCGRYEYVYDKNVQDYEREWLNPTAKVKKGFYEYSKPVADFISSLPDGVQCVVSPGLESNLSTKAGKNLTAEAGRIFTRCRIAWNPMRGSPISGTVYESHGSTPKLSTPCIANLDGEDINFPDRHSELSNKIQASEIPGYLSQYDHCIAANLWVAEFNGTCQGGPFVDPRQRTCWADKKMFERVAALAKITAVDPGVVPRWDEKDKLSERGCLKFIKPKDGNKIGFLWKESDTKKTDSGKLAAIALFPDSFKQKFSTVRVFSDGKRIEDLRYVYQYTQDGGNRQLWLSNRAPKDYPYNVVLKADTTCFRLRNPKERID